MTIPATHWPLQSDLKGMRVMFGNPDANGDGAPDPSWVAKYLTTITPPYQMFYGLTAVKRITVNRGCSAALLAALGGILDHYKTENAIRDVGLHNFSGCYNFRAKRGNPNSLSMHAYACAVDLDAAHNAFHAKKYTMPQAAVEAFAAQGATWGGTFSKASFDPMHMQFSRVR